MTDLRETPDAFSISIVGAALQDDPQWLLDRCGSVGASEIKDLVRKTSTIAKRAKLKAKKVVERLTGKPVEGYQSQAMLEGKQKEPLARAAYELKEGYPVKEVGVVLHPTIKGTHASPDGLVGDDAVLEIKCPEHAAHLATLLERKLNPDYYTQVQWQMACTGRNWAHFVSYHPDFPPAMQLFIDHIPRDDDMIEMLEREVRAFLEELDQDIKALQRTYGDP